MDEIQQKASIAIEPLDRPIRATVRPPGSKSITNRALIVAALADGSSRLTGALDSQDTRVMIESLRRLGLRPAHDPASQTIEIDGCAGRPPAESAELWLENSGTSIRFLTAAACLGQGSRRLDGNARMRQRPIAALSDALNALGAAVQCEGVGGCPPVVVRAVGLRGGRAAIAADLSSQFLSAVLMAAPCAKTPVELALQGPVVSEPYVAMTVRVMKEFGVEVDSLPAGGYRVVPQTYRGRTFAVEPDASAASYFFAAAAITGGEVTVEGLSRDSLQGDVRFVDVLEQMGCTVRWSGSSITVRGGIPLRGVSVDMGDISDTAQTLAAVAVFADGPTRIRNIAHVRHKETDRIRAVVTELNRLEIDAEEHDDGLTINPKSARSPHVRPALIETYDDHRKAMSFALVGLRAPGIRIRDPACVGKTYPAFFDDVGAACRSARGTPCSTCLASDASVGSGPAYVQTARDAAFAVLSEYKNGGRFVAALLEPFFSDSALSAPDERRLAVELTNGVVRREATLDAMIRPHVQRPRHRIEGGIGGPSCALDVYQLVFLDAIPAYAAVNETVALARSIGRERWSGFLNGVLRSVERMLTDEFQSAPDAAAVPIAAGRYRRVARSRILRSFNGRYRFYTLPRRSVFRDGWRPAGTSGLASRSCAVSVFGSIGRQPCHCESIRSKRTGMN